MNGRTKLVIAAAAVFVVAVIVGALFALCDVPPADAPEVTATVTDPVSDVTVGTSDDTTPAVTEDDDWGSTVIWQGETWKLDRGLKTVALLGIDSRAAVEASEIVGGGGRADTILILVLDPGTRTMQLFQVSRDTIISVDVYNNDRELLFSGDMQINMQYAFGENAARSCYLMKKKISELLYGVYVDYCCSLTLDGMAKIINAMDGIRLTLPEDWTDIDPAYTAGATIRMDSSEVEHFVRYRDTDSLGSNDDRMDRQSWFLRQLLAELRRRGGDSLMELLDAAGDDLNTDMDAETMKDLFDYTLNDAIVKLPGETRRGEYHDEYILDESSLRTLVLNTFYRKVE